MGRHDYVVIHCDSSLGLCYLDIRFCCHVFKGGQGRFLQYYSKHNLWKASMWKQVGMNDFMVCHSRGMLCDVALGCVVCGGGCVVRRCSVHRKHPILHSPPRQADQPSLNASRPPCANISTHSALLFPSLNCRLHYNPEMITYPHIPEHVNYHTAMQSPALPSRKLRQRCTGHSGGHRQLLGTYCKHNQQTHSATTIQANIQRKHAGEAARTITLFKNTLNLYPPWKSF